MFSVSSNTEFSDMRNKHFLCFIFTLLHFLTHSESSRSPPSGNPVAFFIFGDSFVDAGNNNYINTTTLDQANFSPYGETFFDFPTGRFSDGRLVSDFIAEFANLPLISPFLQPGVGPFENGVNFASAGAGALVQTFQGSVIDLKTQVKYYKEVEYWMKQKIGKFEAKRTLSKAVYLFSIGSNDYMSPFLTNSTILDSYSQSEYVGMVISNLTSVLQDIYERGGRNFGIINLPPLGCFPGMRIMKAENNGKCFKEASSLVKLHNQALFEMLLTLEKRLMGFKFSLYDFKRSLKQIMDHPSKFGFKEGKSACCGTGEFRGVFSCGGKRPIKEFELCENPNDYVFWDSFHLTEKIHKHMAFQIWNGKGNSNVVVGNYTLKTLFHAL